MSPVSAEPAVPVVDLPRVNTPQFQFFDHTVHAHLVTDDDAMVRWIDALCTVAPSTVAADIETRGLDVHKFSITCVTVAFQLGDDTVAILFDPLRRPEHARRLRQVFDHAERLVFHGASFDIAPLYAHRLMTQEHIRKLGDTMVAARMINTNAKAGRTLEDLASAYGLLDDSRITMAKVFATRGLKKDDGWWATDIDTPTYVVGALSDTVATLRLWGSPGVHGHGIMCQAARYLSSPTAGLGGAGVLTPADAETLVEDVQRVNAIVLARTARGYAVDAQFPQRYLDETAAATRAAATTLSEAGIRPGNGKDLVEVLVAQGIINDTIWPRTATGQLKADKKSLEYFDTADASSSPLIAAHQQVATSEKVLGYVNKVVENHRPTGRLHPEIKILGASATGRMCLPTDQRLLTRRGVVDVNDIRVGDYTLDAHGQWTMVREVHRYSDAPVVRHLLSDGTTLTCTSEHRWVVHPHYEAAVLAPLSTVTTRRDTPIRLRLATPLRAIRHADPVHCAGCRDAHRAGENFSVEGRAESLLRRAGFMPMLVTAGRPPERTDKPHPTASWLYEHGEPAAAPLLEVADYSLPQCAAFLFGLTRDIDASSIEGVAVRVPGGAFLDAVKLVGYRLGLHVDTESDDEGWMVRFTAPAQPHLVMSTEHFDTADVWCVTTDSATFTAWDSDGPYLTGNSASKPEIQQFPSEARGVILADDGGSDWISSDWKSVEPVVLATASGDAGFLADMRAGKDPYEPVGVMAGIDRKLAKRKMLADMYGQGHKAAALQFGWELERAKEVAWAIRDGLPILYRLIDALKRQSETSGAVTTLRGRVVDQRFRQSGSATPGVAERIAPNHFCQGSALDIMHHTILELDRRGLSDHVHLWMHDEIVADASIQDELMDVMATPPPFLQAVASYHGMEAFLAVDVKPLGRKWMYV